MINPLLLALLLYFLLKLHKKSTTLTVFCNVNGLN